MSVANAEIEAAYEMEFSSFQKEKGPLQDTNSLSLGGKCAKQKCHKNHDTTQLPSVFRILPEFSASWATFVIFEARASLTGTTGSKPEFQGGGIRNGFFAQSYSK